MSKIEEKTRIDMLEFIEDDTEEKMEKLEKYNPDLIGIIESTGLARAEIPLKVNIDNLIHMLDDFIIFGRRAYFKDVNISEDTNITMLLLRYKINTGIQGLDNSTHKRILKSFIDYKTNTDSAHFDTVEECLTLDKEGIEFNRARRKILVNRKLVISEPSEKIKTEYGKLSDEIKAKAHDVFYNRGLGKYTKLITMLALIKKFDDLQNKKSLMHFVTASDAGKTYFMSTLGKYFPVANVTLKDIFADRSKVDTTELAKSPIWFQDEHTVLLHDFKELTETVKINKAYAQNVVQLKAPLIVMMSAEDVQKSTTEQFKNRLLKIDANTESIKKQKDISLYHLDIVSNMIIWEEVTTAMTEYLAMSLEEKNNYLEAVADKYTTTAETTKDTIMGMLEDTLDRMRIASADFHIDSVVSDSSGREYLLVKKRQFQKFLEALIKHNSNSISFKSLMYEATSKSPEEFGFKLVDTTWRGRSIKGYIFDVRYFETVSPSIISLTPPPAPLRLA